MQPLDAVGAALQVTTSLSSLPFSLFFITTLYLANGHIRMKWNQPHCLDVFLLHELNNLIALNQLFPHPFSPISKRKL